MHGKLWRQIAVVVFVVFFVIVRVIEVLAFDALVVVVDLHELGTKFRLRELAEEELLGFFQHVDLLDNLALFRQFLYLFFRWVIEGYGRNVLQVSIRTQGFCGELCR